MKLQWIFFLKGDKISSNKDTFTVHLYFLALQYVSKALSQSVQTMSSLSVSLLVSQRYR